MIALIFIISIIVVVTVFVIKVYNTLIKSKNKVKNSWAHIDAQLQRRFDLIPNLVETMNMFDEQEKELLKEITSIKDLFINAHTNKEKLAVDAQLSLRLNSFYNISGKYPKLKSDANFLKLQNALAEIEEDIVYARQFYNDAVTIYNNKLMYFPNNIIASLFGFKEEVLFDAVKGAEKAPRIKKIHNCPNCGAAIVNNNDFCDFCGTSLY